MLAPLFIRERRMMEIQDFNNNSFVELERYFKNNFVKYINN
jgi:hypothetical protein